MAKFVVCTYKANDCAFTATCNGFEVFNCKDGGSGMAQLTPHLIGKGNVLRFKFTHKGPDASFSSGVREADEGEMVNSLEDGDLQMPAGNELVHTFDSQFDELKQLLDTASVADEGTMLAFAMAYCKAIRTGNKAALKKYNRYRMAEASKTFGIPLEALEPQMLEMFTFFKDGGADVGEGDVEVHMITHDKIFEVKRKDGNPLLFKKEEDGSSSSNFIAAILADGPQVVR
ncbi:MAG: hypothetical protein IT464_07965 [Planctomycetes bacterium]|nr:hypothetical protein [Planctomycetota bacterium]